MSEKNLNENKSNLLLLTDIFKPISINQKFIIFLSCLFLLSSLIFSLSLSNIYKSDSLILIIAENESSVPDSLGQFSGLASIAGINLNELNGANKNSKDYIFAKLNSYNMKFFTTFLFFVSDALLYEHIIKSIIWSNSHPPNASNVPDEFCIWYKL